MNAQLGYKMKVHFSNATLDKTSCKETLSPDCVRDGEITNVRTGRTVSR